MRELLNGGPSPELMVVWCCATANTKPRFQSSDDAEYCLYVKLSASAGFATKTSTPTTAVKASPPCSLLHGAFWVRPTNRTLL
jgi:hypothetical protein